MHPIRSSWAHSIPSFVVCLDSPSTSKCGKNLDWVTQTNFYLAIVITLTTTRRGWLIHGGRCGIRMTSFAMQMDPSEPTAVGNIQRHMLDEWDVTRTTLTAEVAGVRHVCSRIAMFHLTYRSLMQRLQVRCVLVVHASTNWLMAAESHSSGFAKSLCQT